ncbi:MAG: hypothetical protein P4L48_23320 [Mycobacterium sp.]|nr:hypothetical protein [Mycobacterium sp.]
MTLTDPREALADQSNFIGYLVGLAGLARVVHTLADADRRPGPHRDPDDFEYALLGLAGIGAAIERLADSAIAQPDLTPEAPPPASTTMRWLR